MPSRPGIPSFFDQGESATPPYGLGAFLPPAATEGPELWSDEAEDAIAAGHERSQPGPGPRDTRMPDEAGLDSRSLPWTLPKSPGNADTLVRSRVERAELQGWSTWATSRRAGLAKAVHELTRLRALTGRHADRRIGRLEPEWGFWQRMRSLMMLIVLVTVVAAVAAAALSIVVTIIGAAANHAISKSTGG